MIWSTFVVVTWHSSINPLCQQVRTEVSRLAGDIAIAGHVAISWRGGLDVLIPGVVTPCLLKAKLKNSLFCSFFISIFLLPYCYWCGWWNLPLYLILLPTIWSRGLNVDMLGSGSWSMKTTLNITTRTVMTRMTNMQTAKAMSSWNGNNEYVVSIEGKKIC